jgi:hypothetical protein
MRMFLRQDKGNIEEMLSFIPDPEALQKKMLNEKQKKIKKSVDNILDLDFLLVQVMGVLQPLDWNIFTKNEASQPLKIVATSLNTLQSVVMSRAKGNFDDLSSLLFCIRASMSVPGVTGKLLALSGQIRKPHAPFYIYERKESYDLYRTDKRLVKIEGKLARIVSFMRGMNRLWVGEAAGEGTNTDERSTCIQDGVSLERNHAVFSKGHDKENNVKESDR